MLWVDDTALPDRPFQSRVLFHYARNPLVLVYDSGKTVTALSDVMEADLSAALRVGNLRLAATAPIFLYQAGDAGNGSGLGDLWADAKVGVVDREKHGLGLAIDGRVYFPTSTVANSLGEEALSWEAVGVIDRELFDHLLLSTNLGLKVAPKADLAGLKVGNSLVGRLGGSWAFNPRTGLGLEIAAEKQLAAPWSAGAALPVEQMVTGYHHLKTGLVLRAGAGTGLSNGIGSPEYRLALGFSYEPKLAEPPIPIDRVVYDNDHDGIEDEQDACPTVAEDMDGFEDQNGCPDPDNDQDGVLDGADACPNIPEDEDQFEDADGCVEPDTLLNLRLVKVYFDTNRATIQERSFPLLEDAAQTLIDFPQIKRVRIEGHTDNRAPDDFNLTLSQQQAEAVKTYLVSKGIDPARMVAIGYGETKPLFAADNTLAWEQNRRVALIVEQWGQAPPSEAEAETTP